MSEFRPELILAALERRGVLYAVIGGLAAVIQGAPTVTFDVDITPETTVENMDRLSHALRDLDARVRTADIPEGLRFDHTGQSLSEVSVWSLTTTYGNLDISLKPAGTEGYGDLVDRLVHITVMSVDVPVAALEDVIRSKEAANREKDQATLPLLRRTLEEIRRQQGR